MAGIEVLTSLRRGVGLVELVVFVLLDALPFQLGWPLGVLTRRLREYRAALEELVRAALASDATKPTEEPS